MLIVLLSVTWSPFTQRDVLMAIGRGNKLDKRYGNMVLAQCMAGRRICP